MGKGKGGTEVNAPNPYEVARADATFNRIDQFTPFGNLVFGGPNRNQAQLTLNPAVQALENRRLLSDQLLLDTALSRQSDIAGGALPSLTSNINPGALNEFFGLPSELQQGTDAPISPPNVPDAIGDFTPNVVPPSAPPIMGGPQLGPRGPLMAQQTRQMQGLDAAQPTGAKGGNSAGQTALQAATGTPAGQSPLAVGAKGGGPDPRLDPNNPEAQAARGRALEGGILSNFQNKRSGGGGGPQFVPPSPPEGGGGKGGVRQQPERLFGGSIGELIDPDTFGQIGSLDQLDDFDIDRGRVEQNFFDRSSSLLDPQFDQQEQRLVNDLRARGISRDSEAFERELGNFRRSKGETFGRLANDAVLAGGGEQSRLFGISDRLGDRAQQAQSQLFQMADLLGQRDIQAQLQNANISQANRATQFNELASLLGLQQVAQPGLNNFFTPGNADVTGGFALNQQAQAGNANRRAGMKGGMLGGAADLGSAYIGGK